MAGLLWLCVLQDPSSLVDGLRADCVDARARAARRLAMAGFAAAPALERAAADRDPEVRAQAARLLRSVPSLAAVRGPRLAATPSGAAFAFAALAPGGRSAALVARRGARALVDERELDAVEQLALSPDGARRAVGAVDGGEGLLLIDGEIAYQGPGRVGALLWSPDSRRLAAEIRESGRAFVLLDGLRGRFYDSVNELIFSPDGRHAAYRAREDGREVVVRGGRAGPSFWRMDTPVFSSSGVLAYAAGPFLEPTLVVGDERARLDGEYAQQLAFSPDGGVLAYLLYAGGEGVMVVGGERRPVIGGVVGAPLFSPDGGEIAYVSVSGAHWRVVRGEVAGPRFDRVDAGSLRYSPDGRGLAYVAVQEGRAVLVAGESGPDFERVSPALWSPDGRRVAYAAWNAEGACVVVGARRTPSFDDVSLPEWSADGRRVHFGARIGGEIFRETIELR